MSRMNRAEKFANGRMALAYQLLRGGGIVLDCMGNDILQSIEWHGIIKNNTQRTPGTPARASVQWEELDPNVNVHEHQYHSGAQACRRDLNDLFLRSPGLWDQTDSGIAWIEATDKENGVMSFHRRGRGQQFACVFNTSNHDIPYYRINLPKDAPELRKLAGVKEVYNTDALQYGGGGRTNANVNIIRDHSDYPIGLELRLPPYTAILLEEAFYP